jgi:hypothetical protein
LKDRRMARFFNQIVSKNCGSVQSISLPFIRFGRMLVASIIPFYHTTLSAKTLNIFIAF